MSASDNVYDRKIEGGAAQPVFVVGGRIDTDSDGNDSQHVTVDNTLTVANSGKIYDEGTGTYKGLLFSADAPQICSQPYLQALAEGDIAGHTPWAKIGYTPTMSNTESVVWSKSGAYVFPATAGIRMQVLSSNNVDDKAGGAGALTVKIVYLDGNRDEHTETVTLDGTNAVLTVATDIARVNDFYVATAGANGKPSGNISLQSVGGGVTYSYITLGYTEARNSVYTVPNGKTLYIVQANLAYGATSTQYCRLYVRASQINNALSTLFYPYLEVLSFSATVPVNLESPLKFVQKVDLLVGGISSNAAGGVATSALRGWLE